MFKYVTYLNTWTWNHTIDGKYCFFKSITYNTFTWWSNSRIIYWLFTIITRTEINKFQKIKVFIKRVVFRTKFTCKNEGGILCIYMRESANWENLRVSNLNNSWTNQILLIGLDDNLDKLYKKNVFIFFCLYRKRKYQVVADKITVFEFWI